MKPQLAIAMCTYVLSVWYAPYNKLHTGGENPPGELNNQSVYWDFRAADAVKHDLHRWEHDLSLVSTESEVLLPIAGASPSSQR